ncbi:hypothetical protein V8G54_005234 [Vigna mungo]|uniref:Uncharacterized protein n=1 Tax=Vigna mungo TaxID=3915 RepID=A0AAQ3PK70_VIGMU
MRCGRRFMSTLVSRLNLAGQLRTAMQCIKLDSKLIEEYLLKIKNYADELVGVGVPIRHEEPVDAILDLIMLPLFLSLKVRSAFLPLLRLKLSCMVMETWLTRYVQETQLNHTVSKLHSSLLLSWC